jgi:hypothetical protein
MFPWCDTQASAHAPEELSAYAVGDAVYSGECRGTVVTVDAEKATMGVVWSDSDDGKPITYPMDASYLRRKMPWE